jgi:hypothetical protein
VLLALKVLREHEVFKVLKELLETKVLWAIKGHKAQLVQWVPRELLGQLEPRGQQVLWEQQVLPVLREIRVYKERLEQQVLWVA